MTFSTSIIEPLNISVVFVDLLGKIYGIIKWSAHGHSLFGAAVCTIYDKVGISYHVWWPVWAWAKSVNKCHTWRWFYSFDELSVIFGCWYYYVVIGVRDFNCIYRERAQIICKWFIHVYIYRKGLRTEHMHRQTCKHIPWPYTKFYKSVILMEFICFKMKRLAKALRVTAINIRVYS